MQGRFKKSFIEIFLYMGEMNVVHEDKVIDTEQPYPSNKKKTITLYK